MDLTSKARERGSSLLTVMVALSIIGIVAAAITQQFSNGLFASRAIKAGESVVEAENPMVNLLALKLHTANPLPPDLCALPGSLFSTTNWVQLSMSGQMKAGTVNLPANAPAGHLSAAGRCSAPRSPTAANSSGYFCLVFNKTPNNEATADSFFTATYAFAEVAISLQSMQTGAAATCNQWKTDSRIGAKVYYTIHYMMNGKGPSPITRDQSGQFIVGRS